MTPHHRATPSFRYERYELDPSTGRLHCHYRLGSRRFHEVVGFDPDGDWDHPGVTAAGRLVFLLAGVSYFKTAAPDRLDLAGHPTTAAERALLHAFYVDGLAEFAWRNRLDLAALRIEGPDHPGEAAGYRGRPGRALIPFGGGIDSIVTAERVGHRVDQASLFVVGTSAAPYAAIEAPAAVSGLPVVRAARQIDPQVLRSAEHGFLNGHVPVTGIISAIAVMAGVLQGADWVVMSNEWSASLGSDMGAGRVVNHQYSKSLQFERHLRTALHGSLGPGLSYFSYLRPYSELWVAQQFAGLPRYHRVFRSCNRAFHIRSEERLDHWCGRCDKCCFIDLILAPFLGAAELSAIFSGGEPLSDPSLAARFRALLGTSDDAKPFECVGDTSECRTALFMALERPDRRGHPLLGSLAREVRAAGWTPADPAPLLAPLGPHHLPDDLASAAPLV